MADCVPCAQKAAASPQPTNAMESKSCPKSPDCCCKNVCVQIVEPPPQTEQKKKKRCKYIQPARPKSYAPERKYIPPCTKLEDNTIYRKSYLPAKTDRPDPIRPSLNLCVGSGKISNNTTQNMSYLPHKVKPPCPIYPCEHKLLGEGPMQDLTTQKHDFVPKVTDRPSPIIPQANLFTSDCPLSGDTINRLSYLPVDVNSVVKPIYPINSIQKPTGIVDGSTIQKLSYQPWQQVERIETPWADKPKYQPPKLRMDGNTVNKMSYMPPGVYVECDEDDDDPDCFEAVEDVCNPSFYLQPKQQQECLCPKAAC